MRIGLPHRLTTAAMIAATAMAAPGAALAEASAQYYERSFVLAADRKCDLFDGAVVSALNASALQARGAAARAGVVERDLDAVAQRARARAARTACADPQLVVVRDRVSGAFQGWSRTPKMSFPGQRADWNADRAAYSSATWRLMQASVTGASPVTFGFAGANDGSETLNAVVSFVGRPRPYAARIVMRDAARSPRPWPDALPHESARRAFWAAGNTAAAPTLLAAERSQGQAWVFPTAAADALAGLDPREPFVVEFLFRDDSVARATFEAGDFAAGRAFLAMGSL